MRNAKEEDGLCYRAQDIDKYPDSFLGEISRLYADDLKENFEWYEQNSNEILLNSVYPSKLER